MLDTAEKLPLLRFVKTAEEDRVASEQAGRTQYKDVIKVYIRSPGDMKTEFVDVAETVKYEVSEVERKVEKDHTVLKDVDGELQEVTEKITVPELQKIYSKKVVTPWMDKQKERLHHKKITQTYFDYCQDAFKRFKANEDQPINGTPLAMWAGAPESVKKAAIEAGILSVESAAEMTSEAMSAIGMGAADLKKNAIAFVQMSSDTEAELKELKAQSAEKDERLSSLEAKLAELTAASSKKTTKQAKAAA